MANEGKFQALNEQGAAKAAPVQGAGANDVKPHAQDKSHEVAKPVGPQGEAHKDAKHGDGKSEISGAVFNLANAIIGAGVGGMPYALKEAGFYGGMMLIIMVALCSDYSVRMLVTLSRKTNSKYYEDLCQSQFGRRGYVFVVSAMGIFAYGAMVAYLMGIGDNMSIVVSTFAGADLKSNPWIKRVTLVVISVVAVLPLALLKNMSALSKTSAVSILSVIFIIGVVIKVALTGVGDARGPLTPEERELRVIDTQFFPAIGVISFAFVCHHACFIVFNTLRDNTEARWATTVHAAIFTATSVMFTLAVAAFLTFRGVMKGSFLTNYSYTDPLCNIMRCVFALAQTLTYPLELFVTRHSVHALAFPAEKWTDAQHYTITLLLWGSSLSIALNVADLGAVLELTGGVAAVSIGFLMPAVLHCRMTPELNWKFWKNKKSKVGIAFKTFWRDYFIFIVGTLAMTFTILSMASHMAAHDGEPHDAFAHAEDGHGTEMILKPSPSPLPVQDEMLRRLAGL